MPTKSSLYRGSSMLFDIDENLDSVSDRQRRELAAAEANAGGMLQSQASVRRVSIQQAKNPFVHHDVFEISQDDPVLGDGISFHRQSSTTHNRNRATRNRNRTRSRRHSATPWPIFGTSMPVLVLRILTGIVVIPAIVAGLVFVPQPSIFSFCVLLACVCLYEYSWLAFRIHYQLLSTYTWYERAPAEEESFDANEAQRYHFQSVASGFSNSITSESTSTFSMHQGDAAFGSTEALGDDEDEDHTIGGEGGLAARAAKMVASPLDMLEFAVIASAVSPIAETWCGGREWLAKLVLTSVFAPLWVVIMHYLIDGANFPVALTLPGSVVFGLPQLTWIAVVLASFLALSAPNMRFAVSILIQLNAFFAIALNSVACPILSIHKCTQPLLSAIEVFALGAVLLLVLRGLTSSSPADMVIVTMVDLLGYLFVVGGFSLLVGVVDVHHDKDGIFARVLLLIVVVLWTAQIAGYACDRLMSHLQLRRRRILPRRVAVRVDLEPSVCAICFGVLATAVGGSLVALPTPLYINVAFAFVAVLLARLGALFMSLVRRAAGVKRSSRLLPGYGGLLDMTSSILFAAIVFSKLYVVVMIEVARAAAAANGQDDRAVDTNTLSIGFDGLGSRQ